MSHNSTPAPPPPSVDRICQLLREAEPGARYLAEKLERMGRLKSTLWAERPD